VARFIHTADWQVGKPYSRVENNDNRMLLRRARIDVIQRLAAIVKEHRAEFVLVAGDLFDSISPDKGTVSAACQAIGQLGVPVLAIPGNHDHAGPGTIWQQEFFRKEKEALAPNFKLLDQALAYEVAGVTILPCPLMRKQAAEDCTTWLRSLEPAATGNPRVALAHGSIQGFSSTADEEEGGPQPNLIDLPRLNSAAFDYLALGDWHGMKQVGEGGWAGKAWYSGTPELDRFAKGGEHDPGNVLLIELPGRGMRPVVTPIRTARLGWYEESFNLVDDSSLEHLAARLKAILEQRVGQDLLRLSLEGALGFAGHEKLQVLIQWLEARLLRLKLDNRVQAMPSESEIARLSGRAGDPLISAIAARLAEEQHQSGRLQALRELYAAIRECGGIS
jgi:DNA repair exonuclease SbcCD nuclease subunit